jgi:VCBS repeat-containing protein
MRYEDTSGTFSAAGTPDARDDADLLPSGSHAPATGNVISGAGTTTGEAGADNPGNGLVVALRGAGGTDTSDTGTSLHVAGRYGTLTMDEHGNYKYVPEPRAPQGVRDVFNYTLETKDGRDTAELVINLGDRITVSENAQRIVPGPDGVVNLPPGVNLSDVHVVGRDLVVTLPDGSQIVIVDGAVFVPQLVLGGVEVPSTNLASLLIESEPIVRPAGGTPQSSGGNFDVPVPPLDPGTPLGDLIPPTELIFGQPRFEEIGQFIDREPEAGTASAQLDDDAQQGGNPGGIGDVEPTNSSVSGSLPGDGGDGSLEWALLASGTLPAGFTFSPQPNGDMWILQGGVHVLTVSVNEDTGAYTVTQIAAIDHPAGGDENDLSFIVNYRVTDDDGDTAIGSLTINVDDDTPTVNVTAGSDANVNLTTHDHLTIGAGQESVSTTADFNNVFGATSFSPGADGAGPGTTSGYALSTTGGASGLFSHGVAINLYNVGGVIVGSTAASAAGIDANNTIFTVSTTNTGIVTLTQFAQIDHTNTDPTPTGPGFDDHSISLADGAITLTRSLTVVDGDGDSVTGSAAVQIGANLHFLDDGPTISLADRGEPSLTVDETDLGTNATASFAANFSASFGADGPAANSITYALGITGGNGVASGLIDVATGQSIVLVNNAGVIEGHVGSAAGALAFTVSVNASGDVTLDQIRALQHPNPANPDDSVTLSADNLVTLTATAHDFDGDTDTATLNIGTNLNFEDDGPSISTSGSEPNLIVDETDLATNASASVAGAFTSAFGADGAGTVAYALGITGGNGTASGLTDVATGLSIVLVNNAGVIEGHVGNAAGALAFTVSIDGAGTVTLDQIRAVTHPNPANPDDSVTLANDNLVTVTATVTDKDGDTASAVLNFGQNLNFEDDGPSINANGTQPNLIVDETVLATNASASFASVFTPTFGADGPLDADHNGIADAGAVTYALGITGGNGTASGLTDVATGQSIVLVNNGGVIEGRTSGSNVLCFTVTVNAAGTVSLDQIRAVVHPDTTNPDDAVTLAADNLITLTATATDGDGDQASAVANIGQNLVFEDDGPHANNDTDVTNPVTDTATGNVITGVDTNEGAGNADQPGADGFGSISNLVGFGGSSDNNPAGGFTVNGQFGTLQMDANGNYTYTRTSGGGGVVDTFTYTYVDKDGDPATATLTITVADETPVAGTVNVGLDDDALAGGNPGGTGDDPNSVNATGNLPGSGGDAPLTFGVLLTGAPAGFTYVSGGPGVVLVQQGGVTVLTVTVNSTTGAYSVVQNNPIDHAAGGDENNQNFTITYTVTDLDTDVANGTINISVDDDTPTVSANAAVQLDDDALAGGNAGGTGDDPNATNVSGTLAHSYGADGAGSVAYLTTGAPAGFSYALQGNGDLWVMQGATHVLTLTVNATTGAYTVSQVAPIDHAAGGDENNQAFTINYRVTDGDGDTVDGSISVNVDADSPTV